MRIKMTGGSPWGFKMTGGRDFRQPLAIGKVTAGSKADRAGVVEGHHIITVNGEDVTTLAHLEAQNKIKAAKATLTLEISNAPVSVSKPTEAQTASLSSSYSPPSAPQQTYNATSPTANKSYSATSNYSSNKGYSTANNKPTYNSSYNVSLTPKSPSKMSTPRSPTYSSPHNKQPSFEDKNATPDIEYRPVDSRDSYRRLYEESQDSEWQPTAHQSTLQSPSMKALAMSSGSYEATHVPEDEKQKLIVTEEIRDMILEAETEKHNGHHPSMQDAALRPTGIKVYDPSQKYTSRPTNSTPSPAPYSPGTNNYTQPPNHSSQSSYGSQSSTGSGPTYSSQPQPAKSKAVGNISKFLQSSGAKQGQPVFAKTLADLQCPFGDPAVLEIRIGNTLPVPTVAWYHNDRPIRESKDKDIKFLSKGIVHTLVLGEFGPEFRGRYKCVLTNKHGSASCTSTLSEEQPQANNNGGYAPAPTSPYGNQSGTNRGYQPSYTSTYQAPVNNQRTSKPMASISVGLYSQNAANEAYNAQTRKPVARDEPEESDVMRALREEGQVGDDKPHYQSRSMRMLNEALMPESDDL
uniref:PDZ and LIM domain protein 5-like n=1 Tax=Styela clava TaxID=7725 RepID=UPI0019399E78|nr:PDZ and LIM domain protein 5-like [Styela clava]